MNQKMLLCACAILVYTLLALPANAPAQGQFAERFDQYIRQAMRDWQTPGLAVAVVKDDSLIFTKGYGVRQLGKDAEVDAHTLFAVASNTKAFTASLIGMLVQERKLTWDARVAEYLPGFMMYDPYVTRAINLKDLLTHRSGLPVFGGDHLWIGGAVSRAHVIHQIRYLEPNAPFRTKFQYNNLMWLVAGEVYATVAAERWAVGIRRRIFEPLGMTESETSIHDVQKGANVATPHEVHAGELQPVAYDDVDAIAPAGAIVSNVVDMAKWMRLHLNAGEFEGQRLLSTAVIDEMQSIQMPTELSDFAREKLGARFSGYGLGWRVSEYRGRKVVRHSGGLTGMISLQTLLPEERLGVIVLSNVAPNRLPWVVIYRILDTFLGEPETDWNAVFLDRLAQADKRRKEAETKLTTDRIKGTRPSLQLADYTGEYENKLSGTARVRLRNGKLVFDYKPRYVADLEHWHFDTFRVTWRDPIFDMAPKSFATFNLDERGRIADLVITFYDPITFRKQ